ncbi:MAG: hypothetical protein GWN31_02310 [Candidatus Thorarchaeota archaeon]|nr:hypothetical protein [Candidatus Thorarchaeota archaeon]NIW50979.1 hypothetical protein [Candidatus Korarchaeota archaeon]
MTEWKPRKPFQPQAILELRIPPNPPLTSPRPETKPRKSLEKVGSGIGRRY